MFILFIFLNINGWWVIIKSILFSIASSIHCSFSSQGVGSFKPLDNSNPYIGSLGELELVEEVKIETIVPQRILGGVISSMINA